ncbi:MAG: glycoside hydrolase family 32 protein [Candidatus Coproplasma sp.]
MEKMVKNLSEINEYINNNKGRVNTRYRNRYHMMPPVGWMNDPNGLTFYNGEYHLFYQFNPYNTQPGTMLWGRFTSQDLITYTDCGAAVIPQTENVSIFSGGAICYEGNLLAIYTEHYECNGEKREEIYCSVSDGGEFLNRKKIFDNERLPENISRTDFRDPYPVEVNGKYYVFIGGKDIQTNKGVILVLGGDTPYSLDYKFTIGPFYELGDMGECPSWRRIDGKDVIIASGCNVAERGNDFKNVNSSVFIIGQLDFENGSMAVEDICEIDKGDCFYAPQFINCTKENIMIGWLEMWGKSYPTHEMGDGWVGSFSIPREISIKDGKIVQTPVSSLDKYCKEFAGAALPSSADLSLLFDGECKVTLNGQSGSVEMGLKDGKAYLDTRLSNNKNGCVRTTNNSYSACQVRVLLDVSSIELFIDGGKEAITSRIYIGEELSLSTEGCATVKKIAKVEL